MNSSNNADRIDTQEIEQSGMILLIYYVIIAVVTLVYGGVMWYAVISTGYGSVVPISVPLVGGVLTITAEAIYKLAPEPWASPARVALPYLVFGTSLAIWGVIML